MKRASTVTLPYTFCLFSALVAAMVLVAGLPVVLALRDQPDPLPGEATRVLHEALDEAAGELHASLAPPVERIAMFQHWAREGVLDSVAAAHWPDAMTALLPTCGAMSTFEFALENGMYWRFEAEDGSWQGGVAEYVDGDPRASTWYRAICPSDATEGSGVELLTAEEGATRIAGGLRLASGMTGGISFTFNPARLPRSTGKAPGIGLVADLDGRGVAQLQDTATRELIERQALPGRAVAPLALLFPEMVREATQWYGARRVSLAPSQDAWLVARLDSESLALPADPMLRHGLWALGAGLCVAAALALFFGRRITRPMRQVAERARSIRLIDEHYLPWPTSRFTEVNHLTASLEEIYEAAVEHLDYHDAPLVVWAEDGAGQRDDGLIDAEATRHVFRFPQGTPRTEEERRPVPIDVAAEAGATALPPAIPAAQLQVLHGTRRELRRLQSQLAGASEELRTADQHHQQDLARMKRLRHGLRALDGLLLDGGCASPEVLNQIRACLASSRTAIWVAGAEGDIFRAVSLDGALPRDTPPLGLPATQLILLRNEGPITANEPATDPRVACLASHPWFAGRSEPCLLAPIRMAGALLGFLYTERPVTQGRWRGDEELFAMGAASAMAGVMWKQMRASGRPMDDGPGAERPMRAARSTASRGRSKGREVPGISWEIDRAGCIRSVSGDVRALYGCGPSGLIGQPITFLCDEVQGRHDMEQLATLLAGRTCRRYETCHRAADGTEIQLRIRAKIWRDASDRIVGARGTAVLAGAVLPT